jgi:hypothetical protein
VGANPIPLLTSPLKGEERGNELPLEEEERGNELPLEWEGTW